MAKKTEKKKTPEDVVLENVKIPQLDHIENELNDLFEITSIINSRIDRIVAAIDNSKRIKGI